MYHNVWPEVFSQQDSFCFDDVEKEVNAHTKWIVSVTIFDTNLKDDNHIKVVI